jgi:MerR family transcriptional regulator, light-induced transcriptional regulator
VAVYSIKDLEMISGIKAHTLRIWEQRYHIIHPKRTPTNIRFYEDDDLKHLLNISLLNKNGLKISKIASMSEEEIAEAVSDLSKGSFEDSVQIDALTISMMELDEIKFETIIAANLQNLGFERTMMEVIYPFLDKLSLLWITGSIHPVQENFISNLVRQKLIAAIDALSANKSCHAGFTLYLPEGESQELSLLFLQYLIKSADSEPSTSDKIHRFPI